MKCGTRSSRAAAEQPEVQDSERGPFQFDLLSDYPPMARDYNCPHVKDCLNVACRKGWDGFTCCGCKDANRLSIVTLSEEKVARVSLVDFLDRIWICPKVKGYTEGNFYRKIIDDVRLYYGNESIETRLISIQVTILKTVVSDNCQDVEGLLDQARTLERQMGGSTDLYKIFLSVCGMAFKQ